MMRRPAALLGLLLLPAAAAACLWDTDTLAQERSRFPTALELITGKYLRHSPEFYQWRAADRRKKLAADPGNLALHDDLVVALDRLGRFDEALEVSRAANRLKPNRYETESNWGTVLLHAGRLEDGLTHLEEAVRINPNAHFGREVYQIKLVRWVLDARKAGRTLPASDVTVSDYGDGPWATVRAGDDWLVLPGGAERPPARAAAVTAVLGMMRTGQHEHPLLLESLGRLLTQSGGEDTAADDAKRLAARAYLRAADVVADPAAKTAYRGLANTALRMQTGGPGRTDQVSLAAVEADLRRELADADAWFAELRAKEVAWVSDPAKDPDAEFAKLYAADPAVVGDGSTVPAAWEDWRGPNRSALMGVMVLMVIGLVVAAVGRGVWRRVRRRKPAPPRIVS